MLINYYNNENDYDDIDDEEEEEIFIFFYTTIHIFNYIKYDVKLLLIFQIIYK